MTGFEEKLRCEDCYEKCFKNIYNSNDYQLLDKNKSEIAYQKNDIIIKQGSYVSQVLYLKSGLIKIQVEGKDEKNTILKIAKRGDFISLSVLNNQDIQPVSVVALCKSVVCHIKKEYIMDIMVKNRCANQLLFDSISKENLFMYQKISILNTRNNHGKLASALLYLSNNDLLKNSVIDFISRKDLAALAGVSLESVNKILLELKNDRIIELNQKKINILKSDLLKILSNVG